MELESEGLTFFAWADTHYGYNQRFGSDDLRWNVIEQMNNLPGWPYPESVGGCVGTPDFAIHLGDMVDGEKSSELELAYRKYYASMLNMPQYEVIGNHDAEPAVIDWFCKKYGGESYSFDSGGIHFISLSSEYDEKEVGHIEKDALEFLQKDISSVDSDAPVILFTHSRLDRLKNGPDVMRILKGKHIIIVMSAHVHKPAVFELEGISCIDVGQCRDHPIDPSYGRNFYVVRITRRTLTALPWRWDLHDWEKGQRWENPAVTARQFMLMKTF